MENYLQDRSKWILKGKNISTDYLDSLVAHNIKAIDDIHLPAACKHLTYGNGCICFVTYNDLYSINFQEFWYDETHEEKPFICLNAKINYTCGQWPSRKSERKIVGIQATKHGLFALSISESGTFILNKWKDGPEGFQNNNLGIKLYIPNLEIIQEDFPVKFLVATTDVHNIVLINTSQGVFIGKYTDGQKNLTLEQIKTFSSNEKHNRYFFSLLEKEVDDRATHVEYLGFDVKKKTLFKYRYALTKTEKSRIHYLNTHIIDKNFVSCDITDFNAANILIHKNPKKQKHKYNKFIFLSVKNPNGIYIAHTTSNDTYIISPLIYNNNDKSNFSAFKEFAFDINLGVIDTIEIINNQILLFGNSEQDDWKTYEFPCIVRNLQPNNHNNISPMDSIVDS